MSAKRLNRWMIWLAISLIVGLPFGTKGCSPTGGGLEMQYAVQPIIDQANAEATASGRATTLQDVIGNLPRQAPPGEQASSNPLGLPDGTLTGRGYVIHDGAIEATFMFADTEGTCRFTIEAGRAVAKC